MKKFMTIIFPLLFILFSVPAQDRTFDTSVDRYPVKVSVNHAANFSVSYHRYYKVVTVRNPWPGASESFTYLLLERNAPRPKGYPSATVIRIPVRSMAALSSTYLTGIDLLGETGSITAVDSRRTVHSARIRNGIRKGTIIEAGSGPSVMPERLILLDPDAVMTMAIGREDGYARLLEAGLPVIINADWNEQDPLGRCEWIKFLALFYNREKEAELFFRKTEKEYLELKHHVAGRKDTPAPRILTGIPWGGQWGVPGGKSYMARLIADAGGDYIWKDTRKTGSILLDPEAVYARAGDADLWLVNGSGIRRLADLIRQDSRHALFQPYKTGQVWNNDLKSDPETGANDWWESGPWYPQEILADLISIFHPALLPDHRQIWFRKVDP